MLLGPNNLIFCKLIKTTSVDVLLTSEGKIHRRHKMLTDRISFLFRPFSFSLFRPDKSS